MSRFVGHMPGYQFPPSLTHPHLAILVLCCTAVKDQGKKSLINEPKTSGVVVRHGTPDSELLVQVESTEQNTEQKISPPPLLAASLPEYPAAPFSTFCCCISPWKPNGSGCSRTYTRYKWECLHHKDKPQLSSLLSFFSKIRNTLSLFHTDQCKVQGLPRHTFFVHNKIKRHNQKEYEPQF